MSDDPKVCFAVRALQDAVFRAKRLHSGRHAGFETVDLEYRLYRLRNALGSQDKCTDADCPQREQEQPGEGMLTRRA